MADHEVPLKSIVESYEIDLSVDSIQLTEIGLAPSEFKDNNDRLGMFPQDAQATKFLSVESTSVKTRTDANYYRPVVVNITDDSYN